MNEYDEQADKFLKDTGTTINIVFLRNDHFFHDDTETRNIYEITLERNNKSYSFKFGDSINNTKKRLKPRPYDVLACLTKYDPGTFLNFCSDFGYDSGNSRNKKIYKDVVEEYKNVVRLFHDVLDQLQEIQ